MYFSSANYEYGPVFVAKGPNKGRIGYLDDTEHEGRSVYGVVYFALFGISTSYSLIPLIYLRPANTNDLLLRHEALWRSLTPYFENPLTGRSRAAALEEFSYVMDQLGERMFEAQFLSKHNETRIFLSHASSDKVFVKGLAVDLSALGYRPWLDEWEILGGESIPSRISEGIDEADFVIVVLSSASIASRWVENEWQAKYWKEISAKRISIIPILLNDCEIPTLLAARKYVDFRDDYAVAIEALEKSIVGHIKRRL